MGVDVYTLYRPAPVKAIGFDSGETLVRTIIPKAAVFCKLVLENKIATAHLAKKAFARAARCYVDEHMNKSDEEASMAACSSAITMLTADAELCRDLTSEYYHQLRSADHLQPFSEVPPMLAKLCKSYDLGVLSNGSPGLTERYRNCSIEHYFRSILVSGEIGAEKPDPKAFAELLFQIEAEREHTVFVGDNLFDDVLGAISIGMRAIWLRRTNVRDDVIAPVPTITSLSELPVILNQLAGECE